MRIVVTGAGGFVGRRLLAELSEHDVVAVEHMPGTIPEFDHVRPVVGDFCDANTLENAFSAGCDAVVHLATVPGGAAEQHPLMAKKVNVDATMALADAAAAAGQCPRFVFASSIAVFGEPMPVIIEDATPLSPRMLYGAHKAMMEEWLATLARRGGLQSLSLRLSGVVARPLGPSGMKSAFMSEVFHALRAGERFVMPVSREATSWIISLDRVVKNFVHALELDYKSITEPYALTLPTLCIPMGDLVDEIAKQVGASNELVSYDADPALEAAFGALPPVTTAMADALGFTNDGDLAALVRRVLDQL